MGQAVVFSVSLALHQLDADAQEVLAQRLEAPGGQLQAGHAEQGAPNAPPWAPLNAMGGGFETTTGNMGSRLAGRRPVSPYLRSALQRSVSRFRRSSEYEIIGAR